ncbi:unnamed protein product [Clonostachys byssicola]|uniref:Uncharacterized protein n=1 Tax=Clonostachys byssicola TaxID=160290 RepID=A0A9N9U861_9HYPO|nr:unnamed protein product [Clonostachys byssicola]
MQGIIDTTWPKGIQGVRDYAGSREFKLHGSPWRASYSRNDDSRQLVLKVLEALHDMGWVLHVAADLSKKQTARDLSAALLQTFGSEVSRHEVTREHLEIKFHGSTWVPSSEDTVHMPLMILAMLETLERFGYSIYASLKDQISYNGEGHDVDMLVMQRHKNWAPGMPVFIR